MKYKLFLTAVTLLFANPGNTQPLDDPWTILEKTKSVYANCWSFYCEGDQQSTFLIQYPRTDSKKVKIYYSRPGRFRIDWTYIAIGGQEHTNSIFEKDENVYFYLGRYNEYKRKDSSNLAIAAGTGISSGLSSFIPHLLQGKSHTLNFSSLERLPDTTINGRTCYVIKGLDLTEAELELAIAKRTFVVLRVTEEYIVSSSKNREHFMEWAEAHPERADKLPPFPEIETPDFQVKSVTTYKNVRLNRRLRESDFAFPLPESALLVDDIPSKPPH